MTFSPSRSTRSSCCAGSAACCASSHLKTQLDRTLAYLAEFEAASRESPAHPEQLSGGGMSVVDVAFAPILLKCRAPALGRQPSRISGPRTDQQPTARTTDHGPPTVTTTDNAFSQTAPRAPVFARHPWVFDSSIDRVVGQPAPGDQVDVVTSEGQFIATGTVQPHEHDPGPALSLGRRPARRCLLVGIARQGGAAADRDSRAGSRPARPIASSSVKETASPA